ncbi:hypothetical protein, partial [Halobacterium bonnevillei]
MHETVAALESARRGGVGWGGGAAAGHGVKSLPLLGRRMQIRDATADDVAALGALADEEVDL